jgi:hypothetical protein
MSRISERESNAVEAVVSAALRQMRAARPPLQLHHFSITAAFPRRVLEIADRCVAGRTWDRAEAAQE